MVGSVVLGQYIFGHFDGKINIMLRLTHVKGACHAGVANGIVNTA
jgi:hypothetical protein